MMSKIDEPARIDVTKEFADCVRRIGGRVLDDELVRPDFKNADFWFPEFEVVAEFKCMSEDLAEDPAFKERALALHRRWVTEGLVPPSGGGKVVFNTAVLPEACSREFLEILKKRFESNIVGRANTQIRETKEYLNRLSAKGLLIVANDADSLYTPVVFAHFIARLLKRQHSNINSVIYFVANFPVLTSGDPTPTIFWVDGVLNTRDTVPKELRVALHKAWSARLSAIVGRDIAFIERRSESALFEALKFKKS